MADGNDIGPITGMDAVIEHQREKVEEAYHLGLLHGINAQSMAQVERDVLSFDDYGWEL